MAFLLLKFLVPDLGQTWHPLGLTDTADSPRVPSVSSRDITLRYETADGECLGLSRSHV
jgi:hypothetical protein